MEQHLHVTKPSHRLRTFCVHTCETNAINVEIVHWLLTQVTGVGMKGEDGGSRDLSQMAL